MSKYIKIKKGLNIKLMGEADKIISNLSLPETFAIKPSSFIGVIPSLLVKQGDEVRAGNGSTHYFAYTNFFYAVNCRQ